MTATETAELLARFDAAWPGSDITPQRADVWLSQLAPVDAGHGEAAANALISESKFFPSIAEFRTRVNDFARRDRLLTNALASGEPLGRLDQAKANLEKLRKMISEMPKNPVVAEEYLPEHKRGKARQPIHNGREWQECDKCKADWSGHER